MRQIDLVIGLPLSGLDEYAESLAQKINALNESVIVFNSRHKNDGKVALINYARMVVADPLCCNYRHLLISEIALNRAFPNVIVTRTYIENNLDLITTLPKWAGLEKEMRENIITLSREYFPPENALKILDILA